MCDPPICEVNSDSPGSGANQTQGRATTIIPTAAASEPRAPASRRRVRARTTPTTPASRAITTAGTSTVPIASTLRRGEPKTIAPIHPQSVERSRSVGWSECPPTSGRFKPPRASDMLCPFPYRLVPANGIGPVRPKHHFRVDQRDRMELPEPRQPLPGNVSG